MSDELKPCPFCGGEAHLVSDYSSESDKTMWNVWHSCPEFGKTRRHSYGHGLGLDISTPWYEDMQEAIECWNSRADHTCHPIVADDGVGAWGAYCSECGYRFAGPYGNRDVPEHMAKRRDIMPRYCPLCGARIEVDE